MSLVNRIYGIKFPFTDNNEDGYFIDIDTTLDDKVASDIIHVILTPKRTRIRRPDFGTDLIKYIFGEADEITFDDVKNEAVNAVSKYVQNTQLKDVTVYRDEDDDHRIYVILKYSVIKGNKIENKEIGVRI